MGGRRYKYRSEKTQRWKEKDPKVEERKYRDGGEGVKRKETQRWMEEYSKVAGRTFREREKDMDEGDINVEVRRQRTRYKDTHVEVMRYIDGRWYSNEEIQGRRHRGGEKELKLKEIQR
jgi:hypothetical protein